MRSSVEVGRDLEQRIAAFFASHGYTTDCNVIVEGRSGGRHEIDVLAEKSDALTTYRVAIECKAWQQPIEKDVVSKLHYVLNDAGLNKGIIVSLGGCRSGAERTAADLGIDLWGPDEIRRHLGDAIVGLIATEPSPTGGTPSPSGRNTTTAWGHPPRASVSAAEAAIQATGKGRLGMRTLESMSWFSLIWLPTYAVQLCVAQPETRRLKTVLKSVSHANLYDALGGQFLGPATSQWEEVHFETRLAPRPLMPESKLHAGIRKAFTGYEKVTSPSAKARHSTSLRQLGIPVPCRSLTIESSALVYLPIYMGVLEAGGQARAEAVDARTGASLAALSQILTTHLPHLRTQLT
jgi:hypothetical protein